MKKPKVSIIVALYNKEKDIKKCLTSILNQSLKEIEIIVINDASIDNSLEEVKTINDSRIKIINNEENQGIGITRNIGIKNATGEYLGFVDADDYIEKDMYEKYYSYAKEKDLDLINTNYYKVFNDRKELFCVDKFDITNIRYNPHIINLINYGPCNKLFRAQMIKDNNIEFLEKTKFEDVLFIAMSIQNASAIGYLEYAGYNYNIHNESETTTVDKRTFDIFKVMNKVNEVFNNLNNTQELEYLNITEITRYMLKQKYQSNKDLINKFINQGYKHLNDINENWKNNFYYKKEPLIKRIIKNNKTFMLFYCKITNRGD